MSSHRRRFVARVVTVSEAVTASSVFTSADTSYSLGSKAFQSLRLSAPPPRCSGALVGRSFDVSGRFADLSVFTRVTSWCASMWSVRSTSPEPSSGFTVTGDAGAVVFVVVLVVDSGFAQAARIAARRALALYLPVVALLDPTVHVEPELIERLRDHGNRGEHDIAGRLISDDLLDKFAFSGNANDIIQQAEALLAAGARRVEFGTPHGLNSPETGIRILGKQVIPELKGT